MIEGAKRSRLARITPDDGNIVLQDTFKKYVSMFYKIKTFVSTMAPFAAREYGPTWFHEPYPNPTVEKRKGHPWCPYEVF